MDAKKLMGSVDDAIKKKNYNYAIKLLKEQILSIYPDDTDARKKLRACVKKQIKEGGKVKGAPSALFTKPKLALAMARGKYDTAMQECENILMSSPEDKGTLYTLADAANQAGYLNTAILAHEECLKLDGRFVKSWRMLGYIYEAQDQVDKALECFNQVTRLDPTDGDSARKLKDLSAKQTTAVYDGNRKKGGHSKDLRKDAEKQEDQEFREKILRTEEDFMKAIALEQKEIDAGTDTPDRNYKKIGEYYGKIGKFKEGIENLEKALELKPTSFDISVSIGDMKVEQFKAKLRKYKKQAEAGDAEAKKKLAATKKKLNDFKITEYQRRVDEHPTDNDQRFHLGQVLFQAGKASDAIEHLQRGTKSPKFKLQSYDLLGQSFLETGEYNLAINQFRKALDMGNLDRTDSKAKSLNYNLARALEETDKDEAIRVFEGLLEQDVNYRDVRSRLTNLRK